MSKTQPALDLAYVWQEHPRGDLTVLLTWLFNGTDRTTAQPCMVLMRTTQRMDRGEWTPCVVTLDSLWKWTPQTWGKGGEIACGNIARGFADCLGFNPNNTSIALTIIGVIEDHIPDLCAMPVAPVLPTSVRAIGSMLHPDTGKLIEAEIKA